MRIIKRILAQIESNETGTSKCCQNETKVSQHLSISNPLFSLWKNRKTRNVLQILLQNMQSLSDMNWDLSFCVKLISTKNMKTLWDAPGAKCPFHSRESLLFIAFATLFEINTKNTKIQAWHIQDFPRKVDNRISRTMLGGHILGPKWLKVVQICPSSQSFFGRPIDV